MSFDDDRPDSVNFEADSDEESEPGAKCISILASLLPEGSTFLPPSAPSSPITVSKSLEDLTAAAPILSLDEDFHNAANTETILEEEDMSSPNDDEVGVSPTNVVLRARPAVPPKPPIDTVRYSMNNIKDSTDWQLDALLEELEELGSQLGSSSGGDQLLLGYTPANVVPRNREPPQVMQKPPVVLHQQNEIHSRLPANAVTILQPSSCSSPDDDSAFGDASSTESAGRCRNSAISSSNDSCRDDSIHTPSPTQVSPRTSEQTPEELKAAKIRQALEKMKEAKVIRIFVKFFIEDGAPLQMLVDERWTVAETMKQLAEKNHIDLMEDHCIVEEFPDLYIKRIYEDHENLVENIQLWQQDSPNKLYFLRRPDKYPFIDRPEQYLVTEKTTDMDVPSGDNWTREVKAQFVQDFFARDTVSPPEMEGFLLLKSDGRKNWKKHYFVLRPSGLYFSPKGKKSSKDLQCLMNLHSNQVYVGINWQKKYKAPTEWCISIKLTTLQIKRSQYIKYICADDEPTFRKWVVALRIAKNGAHLLKNYEASCALRREALTGGSQRSFPSRTGSSLSQPISVNTRDLSRDISRDLATTSSASSSQHDLLAHSVKSALSPSAVSRVSGMTSVSEKCNGNGILKNHSSVSQQRLEPMYDEQPTGTIKRAPLDVLRRVSSRTSSNDATSMSGCQDEDSDEEFPAPPPVVVMRTSTPTQIKPIPSPAPTPKPVIHAKPTTTTPTTPQDLSVAGNRTSSTSATSVGSVPSTPKKTPPPPPPKRSDATKLQTPQQQMAAAQAMAHSSDLEKALARRREKMAMS